jgi:hypothetical protein
LDPNMKLTINDDSTVSVDDRYFQGFRRTADGWFSSQLSSRRSTYEIINKTYKSLKQYPDYYVTNIFLVQESINNLQTKLPITYPDYRELSDLLLDFHVFYEINGTVQNKTEQMKSLILDESAQEKIQVHDKTAQETSTSEPIVPVDLHETSTSEAIVPVDLHEIISPNIVSDIRVKFAEKSKPICSYCCSIDCNCGIMSRFFGKMLRCIYCYRDDDFRVNR